MTDRDDLPPVVSDYLDRLDAATSDLTPDVRDDLLADVRGHLDEVVERAASEAQLRQALDRLGSPEAIASEARGALPPPAAVQLAHPPPPARPATSRRGFDVAAILVLLFGGLVLTLLFGWIGTLVGWLTGVGMLWSSRSWTGGEKALATLVWPGGVIAPLLLGLISWRTCAVTTTRDAAGATVVDEVCTGFALPVWIGIPLLVVLVAAPVVVAGVLLRRADQRR